MQVGADGFRDLVGAGISWVLNRGAQAAHASLTTSKRAALRFGRPLRRGWLSLRDSRTAATTR